MFKANGVPDKSSNDAALGGFVTREPSSIFSQIKNVKDEKGKKELNQLLERLRKELPEGFKIGAAVGEGDCFFDSVAQGLNELKGKGLITDSKGFSVKSLRKSCKQYAQQVNQSKKEDLWLDNALKVESEKLCEYIPRIEFTAEDIKNASSGSIIELLRLRSATWGRPEIEGKIISDTYDVELYFYSINEEYGQKITVTKITPSDNDPEVFIEELNLNKLQIDNNGKVVGIVNHKSHFVPLLDKIEKDIEESIQVSREGVYGEKSVVQRPANQLERNHPLRIPIINGKARSTGKRQRIKTSLDNEDDMAKKGCYANKGYKGSDSDIEIAISSPAELTIGATGDYLGDENRLSSKHQYTQSCESQESRTSPKVARSSYTSRDVSDDVAYGALTDDGLTTETGNSIAGTSLTSDEIIKAATFFIKAFVKSFEEKLSEYSGEAKPGSKIRKSGKIMGQIDSGVKDIVPAGPWKLIPSKAVGSAAYFTAKSHREKAKKSSETIEFWSENGCKIREILVKAGLEIFQKFENQVTRVVDVDKFSWKRQVQKLAIDAAYRAMNYISGGKEGEDFSVALITKGVISGKSKKDTFIKLLVPTRKLERISGARSLIPTNQFEKAKPGHTVKDKQSGQDLSTSGLYAKAGIKKTESDGVVYYQLVGDDHAEKYGYRLPFAWELENWEELKQKYVAGRVPEEGHVYILESLSEEDLDSMLHDILEGINGEDPAKKKDIEKLGKELMSLKVGHRPFSFDLWELPKHFITRQEKLNDLIKKLESCDADVVGSRVVLISGGYGTGKSLLAQSCARKREHDGNVTWTNVIWINAATLEELSDSFDSLAKKLRDSAEEDEGVQEINARTEAAIEGQVDYNALQRKKIEFIVKNIYEKFRDTKSLFIFDNANDYEQIRQFLPSYFPDLFFHSEKPYVLITSRNKNWKGEIEEIGLDDGFDLAEAITFIKKDLEIKDSSQDDDVVNLVKALCRIPFALVQATASIKSENRSGREFKISDYLKDHEKAMRKSDDAYFNGQGITKELFTTLQTNFNRIKEKERIGQQSFNILSCMAYLNPNQIDIEELFLLQKPVKDRKRICDSINLLDNFSLIALQESTAKICKGTQKAMRLEKRTEGKEEEALRKTMKLVNGTTQKDTSHIISVWSHASEYDKLVNEFIDSTYDGDNILHLLVKNGNEKVIKLILEKTCSSKLSGVVNAVDQSGFAPLHYAAAQGDLGIVKYLVEKGANLKIDDGYDTPLYYAAMFGKLEIVKYFIYEKYFELDGLDENNNTPLYCAIKKGYSDIVGFLVKQGATVDLKDEDGKTPLHFAATGPLEIVQLLLEKNASVNLQDKYSRTPLHWAVINGCSEIVQLLLKKKAYVNLQDKYGRTPLHWAIRGGYLDIAKCLLEQGATVDLKNEDGRIVWNLVDASGRKDIGCYLRIQSLLNSWHSGSCSSQSKKRKLESMSATSEENASSIQLPQGSQDTVNLLSEMRRLSVKLQHRLGFCAQGKISTQFESPDGPEISVEYFVTVHGL